jgi:hypothetical protein
VDEKARLVALGEALEHLLLASYGMHPDDLADDVAAAGARLGGADVVVLLVDMAQRVLRPLGRAEVGAHDVDGPGPGLAYREERPVREDLGDGRTRLWVPAKDSSERVGVIGAVLEPGYAEQSWATLGSLVGELIVSKSHYGDAITLARRASPVTLAAEMRWALLAPLVFTSPEVHVAGIVQPPYEIAGDAFDYGVTAGMATVAVLDAMGHGLEASRMANVAISTYRNARRNGSGPAACVAAVDDVIATAFGEARYVTMQVATVDLRNGRLVLANAGHPRPLVLRGGKRPEELSCPAGRPAGLGVGTPATVEFDLAPGDAVLFQTDGIVDARAPSGEAFGEERLASIVAEQFDRGLPIAEVLRLVGEAVIAHQAGRPGDDRTLVLLRYRPPTATRS